MADQNGVWRRVEYTPEPLKLSQIEGPAEVPAALPWVDVRVSVNAAEWVNDLTCRVATRQ